MTESPTLQSPCVNICVMDERSGLCIGCARTVDEIAQWIGMSAAERVRIMAELPLRQQRVPAKAD